MKELILRVIHAITKRRYLIVVIETLLLLAITLLYLLGSPPPLRYWPIVESFVAGFLLGLVAFVFLSMLPRALQNLPFDGAYFSARTPGTPNYTPEDFQLIVAYIVPVLAALALVVFVVLAAAQVYEWLSVKKTMYACFFTPGLFVFLATSAENMGILPEDRPSETAQHDA